MEIKKKKVSELKPYENNPKHHPEEQIEKIAKSITEFGFKVPLLITPDKEIIAGHGRLRAAEKLNLEEVPCIIAKDFTEEQVKAFRIADNRIAESGWDYKALQEEFEELDNMDLELDLTGFDVDEIEGILDGLDIEDQEIEEDDFDEEVDESKPAITELGDVIELGRHRLMCGDSTKEKDFKKLMNGKKADMVFTDPPYGLGGYGGRNNMELKGDDDNNIKRFYDCIPKDIKEVYIWGNYKNLMYHLDKEPRDVIVWVKNNFGLGRGYRGQYELCFYYGDFGGSDSDVWEIKKDTDYMHPTQKPLKLPARAMKNSSNKNNLVLDLFGGSGSTLIAAEQLERTCYMMELEEHYCDVTIRRYIDYKKNKNEEIDIKVNGEKINYNKYEKNC